ncbi:MAG: YtxH domain-containing protein [Candidatus Gastranaerophilales bacterium]|nr:YtxH domain-containing protein [Candidatus Gastranaerophilales bacterium]
MSEKNNSISFGLGLIAGVIGGIITGVLYAPKPGEESRKELKEVITDLREKHSPEIKEAKKQALESIDLAKYKLERQYRKLTHMLKSKKLRKAKELEDTEYDLN